MCDEITIIDGPHIDTTAELAAVIGVANIVKDSRYQYLRIGNVCLCAVDIPATAAAAGYESTGGEWCVHRWRKVE